MYLCDLKTKEKIFNLALKYINDNKNKKFNSNEIEPLEDALKIKYSEIIKNDNLFFNRRKRIIETKPVLVYGFSKIETTVILKANINNIHELFILYTFYNDNDNSFCLEKLKIN